MPLALPLPLVPMDALIVSEFLAILEQDGQFVFFNAAGAIHTCDRRDRASVRLAAVTMLEQELVGVVALAKALGLHRTTLFRDWQRFKEGGVPGVLDQQRGPKGPHKMTAAVRRRAQRQLDRGLSMRAVAMALGVNESTIRLAVKQGVLGRASAPKAAAASDPALVGPAARATEDQSRANGVGVKREEERALARIGQIEEAPPEFHAAEGVAGAGVLLALPALLEEGLLDVAETVYSRLKKGFFGLRSVLLTFAFMALLRIKTPEQLTTYAPGELGLLLGLDRAPEVKTLRRKLGELGERRLADLFAKTLTERWVAAAPEELGILYVDGHVRPYHGRTHSLPKLHVQQRGRPMPGTKDFHVADRRADPLFFVTADTTEGILETLESDILPRVREYVGEGRRVTIVCDRECWSPISFAKWKGEGFDVLTYRKGEQSRWQERFFEDVKGTVDGRKVEYRLAERRVKLSNGLDVREIRRLTEDGHQTSIITTNEDLPMLSVARWMFGRWRQENFFRYMEMEFDLNHLATYEVEPADPTRLVTPPERTALEKKLKAARAKRTVLFAKRLDVAPGAQIRVGRRHLGEEEIDEAIRKQEIEIDRLTKALDKLPKRVPLDTVRDPKEIVQLERERKILTDLFKLTAYRAESRLVRLAAPLLARHEEDARKFIKLVCQATADLIPDARKGQLIVRFHGLSSPRASRAMAGLCEIMNARDVTYPGTALRLRYEAPGLQK